MTCLQASLAKPYIMILYGCVCEWNGGRVERHYSQGPPHSQKILIKTNPNILTFYIKSIIFQYFSNKKISIKQNFLLFYIKHSFFFFLISITSITVLFHFQISYYSQIQPWLLETIKESRFNTSWIKYINLPITCNNYVYILLVGSQVGWP